MTGDEHVLKRKEVGVGALKGRLVSVRDLVVGVLESGEWCRVTENEGGIV